MISRQILPERERHSPNFCNSIDIKTYTTDGARISKTELYYIDSTHYLRAIKALEAAENEILELKNNINIENA